MKVGRRCYNETTLKDASFMKNVAEAYKMSSMNKRILGAVLFVIGAGIFGFILIRDWKISGTAFLQGGITGIETSSMTNYDTSTTSTPSAGKNETTTTTIGTKPSPTPEPRTSIIAQKPTLPILEPAPKPITQTPPIQGIATSTPTTPGASSATGASSQAPPSLPPLEAPSISINPRSIVGVLCYYHYGNGIYPVKGSGVIVNSQGYVLTAKHLVDPSWTRKTYATSLSAADKDFYAAATLDHCTIGLPEITSLPSIAQIQQFNPGTLNTRSFQYIAQPYFVPDRGTLSEAEFRDLDFSVLKITAMNDQCFSFNRACDELGHLPYNPVLYTESPRQNTDQVLSFGYPAEAINQADDGFYDFYLKGAVGHIENFFGGNLAFANRPLTFSFVASDLQIGRSGSPLFFKGYVVGILYGESSTEKSYNVSMAAIHSLLTASGQGWILATH
jgi:hypothetical protein